MAISDPLESRPFEPTHFQEESIFPGARIVLPTLIVLGILGIAAGIAGVAVYGAYQGWWSGAVLSKLSVTHSLFMMGCGIGGILLLFGGLIGRVLQTEAEKRNLLLPLALIYVLLENGHCTYALQNNGDYAHVQRNNDSVRILLKDIQPVNVKEPENCRIGGFPYQPIALTPPLLEKIEAALESSLRSEGLIVMAKGIIKQPEFITHPQGYLEKFLKESNEDELLFTTGVCELLQEILESLNNQK